MAAAKQKLAINSGKSLVGKAKAGAKTNGKGKGKTMKKKTTTTKKKIVRRNPTRNATVNNLIAAFGGALSITTFDYVVNYFFPTLAVWIKTAAKFGAAFFIGNYGKKVPFFGAYSGTISNTLYVFGFVDLLANHVLPRIMPYLPQPAPALPAPTIVQTASGELGALVRMPDGSNAVVIDETGALDNGGYGYGAYGGDYSNNYQYGS